MAKTLWLAFLMLLLPACVTPPPPELSEDEQWLVDHQWIWDNLLYIETYEQDGILYFRGCSAVPPEVDDAI